eukprot:TRINITY_DN6140_c0_g1_i1.p1 TRINITY_DN6140_c0_g1~~TRINITY_DN6140_c0_g1_i1.p1  ORF type:complete len:126 (-),score=22.07 TRINITY_DN6140_c0_g1_i1:45-422(-)
MDSSLDLERLGSQTKHALHQLKKSKAGLDQIVNSWEEDKISERATQEIETSKIEIKNEIVKLRHLLQEHERTTKALAQAAEEEIQRLTGIVAQQNKSSFHLRPTDYVTLFLLILSLVILIVQKDA